MATPIDAQGTIFNFYDGSSNQVIGGIQSFALDGDKPEREVSTLASTAVERKLGLPDNGNLTLDILYDPSDVGQAAVIAAEALNATREIVMTLSDGTVKTFDVTPKTVPITGDADDDLKSTLVLTVAGAIVTT